MGVRIVNIKYKIITPTDEHLLSMASTKNSEFKYKYLPIIAYNTKTADIDDLSQPQLISYNTNKPFVLYEFGVPITLLRSYSANRISKDDLLSVKTAFRKLKNIAAQCYERVIADLCCEIILKEMDKLNESDELIFFLERPISDKMLGRLGTLYLDLSKTTISFLTFRPSDLLTTVMSYHSGKITFDIHRLIYEGGSDFFGPYPGDSEDSLIQTYFYRPIEADGGGTFMPMRIDFFAQGLLIDAIDHKKDLVKNIFISGKGNTEDDRSSNFSRALLPYGYLDLERVLTKSVKDIEREIYHFQE